MKLRDLKVHDRFLFTLLAEEMDRYDPGTNYIGRLQEWHKQHGLQVPVYTEVKEKRDGTAHSPRFTYRVYAANGAVLGEGYRRERDGSKAGCCKDCAGSRRVERLEARQKPDVRPEPLLERERCLRQCGRYFPGDRPRWCDGHPGQLPFGHLTILHRYSVEPTLFRAWVYLSCRRPGLRFRDGQLPTVPCRQRTGAWVLEDPSHP